MTDSEHSLPCTDPASTGTGVPAQPPPPVSASASRALPSSLVPLPSRCFLLKEDALSSKRLFVRPLQCGSLLLAQLCCLAECFLSFSCFSPSPAVFACSWSWRPTTSPSCQQESTAPSRTSRRWMGWWWAARSSASLQLPRKCPRSSQRMVSIPQPLCLHLSLPSSPHIPVSLCFLTKQDLAPESLRPGKPEEQEGCWSCTAAHRGMSCGNVRVFLWARERKD